MKLLFLALTCLLGPASLLAKEKPPTTYAIPLPPKTDFSALVWLVGEWVGKTIGGGPQGEIRLSVVYELDKRFLILREETSLPATPAAPAANEAWLGILSGHPSRTGFVLRSFSTTGFVTRYRVTVEEAQVHFNPEGGDAPPPGWLFRRTVRRLSPTEIGETLALAPPGKPFFEYYTARLTRKAPQ